MNPLNTVNGTIIGGVVLAILIGLATMGFVPNEMSLLVLIHVLAGVTWIGLLYYLVCLCDGRRRSSLLTSRLLIRFWL